MSNTLTCFKAYDIRGRVPDELNEDIAYRIGRAFAEFLKPKRVAVGRDIRLDSPALATAVSRGLCDGGADVFDIGQCGTEEVYFATFHHELDGGIMVTASHNPIDFNGMKLVREGSRPISGDTGLDTLRELAEAGEFSESARKGKVSQHPDKSAYIEHLLTYIDVDSLKPLRIVVNPGNGGAGDAIDQIESHLPFELIKVNYAPDGTFPNGIPNPLLTENRSTTHDAVISSNADMGIAWDGDFDRCFFFDSSGRFIEGYYLVGLLAEALLKHETGGRVIHDPRLTWNTQEMVKAAGGVAVQSKTGHAFIKERMRAEDAIYGGEMSAHHYFRDFAYCDSGMIPWLLVAEQVSRTGLSLAELVAQRMQAFPCSGEINFRVENAAAATERVLAAYSDQNPVMDHTDGVSVEFADWRFNLRSSNTEPLMRLNVESRGDAELVDTETAQISRLIEMSGN